MSQRQYIYVGRLEEIKGIRILFEAWKLFEDPAPKLIVCGKGPLEEWCRSYISKNNLSQIEMRGFLSGHELTGLVAGSRALILPTQWYEGFPMVILEAFSVGTPVIVSDLGNAGSLVEEGDMGRKFCFHSAYDLMQVLLEYENNMFRINTHKAKKYCPEANYQQLLEIYHNISKME